MWLIGSASPYHVNGSIIYMSYISAYIMCVKWWWMVVHVSYILSWTIPLFLPMYHSSWLRWQNMMTDHDHDDWTVYIFQMFINMSGCIHVTSSGCYSNPCAKAVGQHSMMLQDVFSQFSPNCSMCSAYSEWYLRGQLHNLEPWIIQQGKVNASCHHSTSLFPFLSAEIPSATCTSDPSVLVSRDVLWTSVLPFRKTSRLWIA